LLDQVANDLDDFILNVEAGTFIETVNDNERWVRLQSKRHGVENAGYRGYAPNRLDNQRFHLRLQRLVEDVRVLADRLVNITFRRGKSFDELSCQRGEEETTVAAVRNSI